MKRILITILLISGNLVAFSLLFLLYYFVFELKWEATSRALTWGLPLPIAALAILTAVCWLLKKNSWRWGVTGLAIGGTVLLYTAVIIIFEGSLILTKPVNSPEESPAMVENQLLPLILSDDGIGYTVVRPETGLFKLEDREQRIDNIVSNLGEEFSELAELLYDLNHEPTKLTIPSAPQDGYYIDYDGKFAEYLEVGLDGWERFHIAHPTASGFTRVSIPAYDPETGYILVYIGEATGSLGGKGWIVAYKYENAQLNEIKRIILWIA